MTQKIYALLVGINEYQSHKIPNLEGCINDIQVIENCLLTYISQNTTLSTKILTDKKATRQAIIDSFKDYLCQADSDDIVLFYFSGHGSQEVVPQEFIDIQTNGYLETLICWDSRTENNWDLADKELIILINQVAQKNPQIVVILDCCHSGGDLRGENTDNLLQPRFINANSQARPVSSYYSPEAIKALLATYMLEKKEVLNSIALPKKCIFFSACTDNEKAYEYLDKKRGVFSYFLTDILQQTQCNLSYQDLFNRVKDRVEKYSDKQSPQFEVGDSFYKNLLFLGDSVVKRESYYKVTYDSSLGWIMNAGGIHGITSSYEKTTMLAIFSDDLVSLDELDNKIAVAKVIHVASNHSQINLLETSQEINPELTYKASITNSTISPLNFYLEGNKNGLNLARKNIEDYRNKNQALLLVKEVSSLELADFKLVAQNDSYLIIKLGSENFTLTSINGYSSTSCAKIIEIIEHILRWHTIADLSSNSTSLIAQDAIEVTFFYRENVKVTSESFLNLKYEYKNGHWYPPKVQIELTNTSNIGLYCALLNLTELYEVKSFPFTGNSHIIYLESGAKIRVFEGKAIPVSIPNHFKIQNVNKCKDMLKLLCSTREFDILQVEQPSLEDTNRAMDIPSKIVKDSWTINNYFITTINPQRLNINCSDKLDNSNSNFSENSENQDQGKISHHPEDTKKNKQKFVIIAIALISLISICIFVGQNSEQQELDNNQQSKRNFILFKKG